MAELIDKNELKKQLNITGDLREYHRIIDYPLLKEIIAELPTVTEAEIRNKAIEKFAEKLKCEYVYIDVTSDDMVYGKYRKYIDEIAEQLKGE